MGKQINRGFNTKVNKYRGRLKLNQLTKLTK